MFVGLPNFLHLTDPNGSPVEVALAADVESFCGPEVGPTDEAAGLTPSNGPHRPRTGIPAACIC